MQFYWNLMFNLILIKTHCSKVNRQEAVYKFSNTTTGSIVDCTKSPFTHTPEETIHGNGASPVTTPPLETWRSLQFLKDSL